MKHRLTASLLCLLAACSSVAETGKPSIQSNRKETQAMSDTETAMTPKQLLTRLLKLMETSDTVDDFTPEKISKTFGVPLEKFFFDNASPTPPFLRIQTKNQFQMVSTYRICQDA